MTAPRILVDLAALARIPDGPDPDSQALPTLGRLAREGRLRFCTYGEFAASASAGRGTWRGLLGDVPVETIAPAIARAELGEDVFRDSEQSGALARLCTRLKHREGAAEASPTGASDGAVATPDLDRFARIAGRVQGHHLADLFHLWSAELAGCRYWMTADGPLDALLRERVQPYLNPPLACELVRPDALLRVLGVVERDPRPLDPRRVVPLRPRPATEPETPTPHLPGRHDG